MRIRLFNKDDWDIVKQIYHLGMATGKATFETTIPDCATFVDKFAIGRLWVGDSDGVVAWGGLQPVSSRQAYKGVMEITIYVHPDSQGKGIATKLITFIINESEKAGIWTLYAAIIQENEASIKLHTSAGFREIGYREKIAKHNGQWRNTVLFERRSTKTGI